MTNEVAEIIPDSCGEPTGCDSVADSPLGASLGEFQLRPANESDRTAVSDLLSVAKLAALDEFSQFGPQYTVAYSDDQLIGVAGLELYGGSGLLRSVAVTASLRSKGLGRKLTLDRLTWAANVGVSDVFLLTTDGAGYWSRYGFSEINRGDAPASIRATSQWSGGCSSAAVAMKRVANGG